MRQTPQPPPAITPASGTLAPITIADGTLEALKWLGIVLMTLDHVNRYLLAGQVPLLFVLGRVAMPLFGFVLAYNLARRDALATGAFRRTRNRLMIYGAVATIPFVALKAPLAYGWWPLNVLFTLWAGTLVIELLERRRPQLMLVILPLFSFGSLLPEYWHLGTGAMIAAWHLCKQPRASSLVLWILPLAALVIINHNFYALLVIPLVYAARFVDLPMPRYRHVFYVFYPAHLAVLWLVQALIG